MMARWTVARAVSVVAMALWAMASPAWAQEQTQPGTEQPQLQREPPLPLPTTLTSYPLELLGLLAPPSGATVLIPSIGFFEEYNDNLFLVNTNKTSDFKTEISPAVALFVNRPRYRIIAGYSFSSELHSHDSNLNEFFGRQNFLLGSYFNVTRDLSLRLSDSFAWDRNSGTGGSQPFTVGRQLSWVNTFSPGALWQITPRTSLDLSAGYEARRFLGSGIGLDSDTYRFDSGLGYGFTSRFTGTIGYSFTYIDTHGDVDSTTHNPHLGFRYALTPSLTFSISGGPAITQIAGETDISPAGNVGLMWYLRYGYLSAEYTRGVSVAGGFGGTTDTQTVALTLALTRLVRNMVFFVTPSYNNSQSVSNRQADQVDIQAYAVSLGVTYQISRYFNVFAGYDFLHQRTGGGSTLQVDADQNRVKVGLQFGYPISFN